MEGEMLVLTGNANRALAQKICSHLDVRLGEALVSEFSDGETRIEISDNVRGRDVFIIQPTSAPANQHLMEALIMADACRRASAKRITLVSSYFGYARQERKSAPRTPITAKLVADLITSSGVDRILGLELHTSAIQGFFNIPFDHLFARIVIAPYFNSMENLTVVSPDAGGVETARAYAKVYGCDLAIIDKRRERANESEVMHVIGDVKGRNCLIIDDICDTAGSLTKAADAIMAEGAASVTAAVCHAVLSGPAIERIQNCDGLKELIVTDSIPLSREAQECMKIKVVSIAELLAKGIRRIHNADSISSLFM